MRRTGLKLGAPTWIVGQAIPKNLSEHIVLWCLEIWRNGFAVVTLPEHHQPPSKALKGSPVWLESRWACNGLTNMQIWFHALQY